MLCKSTLPVTHSPPWEVAPVSTLAESSEAPAKGLEHSHHLPYGPPECCVGRDLLLADLHGRHPLERVVVVAGPEGIGKTTVALAYAHRFGHHYRELLYVNAADGAPSLIGEFARLSLELGVRRAFTSDAAGDAETAKKEIETAVSRLLIIDNALDEQAVRPWIPQGGECHTVIISPTPGWSTAATLVVPALAPNAASELLLRRSERASSTACREAADRLARELNHHPLALELAARYCRREQLDFDHYLELCAGAREELPAAWGPEGAGSPDPVRITAWLTLKCLTGPALAIFRLSSYLGAGDVPLSLFDAAGPLLVVTDLDPDLDTASESEYAANVSLPVAEALAELADFSLIRYRPGDRTYGVHGMLQAVTREAAYSGPTSHYSERAMEAVSGAFPEPEEANWAVCEQLLPHAHACAARIVQEGMQTEAAARLLTRLGMYLLARGQDTAAEKLLRHALAIDRRIFGEEHTQTTTDLEILAGLLFTQQKLDEAESLYRQSHSLRERLFGAQHVETALSLNNLGAVLRDLGRNGEAEPLLRRSVAILEAAAEEPLHRATALHNLAELLWHQENTREAEVLLRRSVTDYEAALGEEHPIVAGALSELAWTVYSREDRDGALALLERPLSILEEWKNGDPHAERVLVRCAELLRDMERDSAVEPAIRRCLAVCETVLGTDHVETAAVMLDLGELLRKQERFEEAEPFLRRCLAILEAKADRQEDAATAMTSLALTLHSLDKLKAAEPLFHQALAAWVAAVGEQDPQVGIVMLCLAILLKDRGKLAEAECLFLQALKHIEDTLGRDSEEVANLLRHLGHLKQEQIRLQDAERYFRWAVSVSEEALGVDHPGTADALHDLAQLLQERGKYAEAEVFFRMCLAKHEACFGPEHPDTATSLFYLAELYRGQGKTVEAERNLWRVLAIYEAALGPEHPYVAAALNSLASLLRDEGRLAEAVTLFERSLAIREATLGAEHPETQTTREDLSTVRQLLAPGVDGWVARLRRTTGI